MLGMLVAVADHSYTNIFQMIEIVQIVDILAVIAAQDQKSTLFRD